MRMTRVAAGRFWSLCAGSAVLARGLGMSTSAAGSPALLHPALFKLARQGAAVHAELARGLGDVEVGRGQGLVDVFPLQGLDRGLAAGERHAGVALAAAGEGGLDVVGVRRL